MFLLVSSFDPALVPGLYVASCKLPLALTPGVVTGVLLVAYLSMESQTELNGSDISKNIEQRISHGCTVPRLRSSSGCMHFVWSSHTPVIAKQLLEAYYFLSNSFIKWQENILVASQSLVGFAVQGNLFWFEVDSFECSKNDCNFSPVSSLKSTGYVHSGCLCWSICVG